MDIHSDLTNSNFTPAPIDYRPNFKVGKESAPSFTIKDKHFRDKVVNDNPAPGTYQSDITLQRRHAEYIISTKQNGPSISFAQAGREDLQKGISAGPGSYNIAVDTMDKRTKPLTIGARYPASDTKGEIPAPNAYSPKLPKSQSSQFSMGRKNYPILADERDFPGPGAYDNTTVNRGPKHSIYARPETNHENGVPGPCAYETEVPFANARRAKSFNRASRFRRSLNDNPAANAYVAPTIFDGSGGFSLRSRPPETMRQQGPAANHYAPEYGAVEKNVKGAIIHHKFPAKSLEQAPGVGQYDIPTPGRSARMITIAPRHPQFEDKNPFPGPQDYSPSHNLTKESVPDIRPGVKYSERQEHLKVGPGSYDISRSISKDYANVPVLHEKHEDLKALMENPGPGAYSVDRNWKRKRGGGYIAGRTRRAWRTEL